ncbi:MAG: tRNA (adenosine(37)-N6)-threonylcarbamoyltransferase complex dimerization subunit type 1 TsaB [Bacteroidales bacterium]|nr:tRNA (adenosine(37)-N6)-threonylcarbamoyltransferase complex dimerization subunit type 1 TsaB [Bacteroidales bacterium]
MSKILHIETATNVCSVAISDGEQILVQKETREGRSHATILSVFIREAMAEAGLTATMLDAVAISKGPGSYTGLRIGVSTAKGICYAADLPLISVSTLESMALGFITAERHEVGGAGDTLYLPMIDARRMEVYTAAYDRELNEVMKIQARVIDGSSFKDLAEQNKLKLFGSGADKLTDIFKNDRIQIIESFKLSASYMVPLALNNYVRSDFVNLAYFEPYYLKDFITTVPKKTIF